MRALYEAVEQLRDILTGRATYDNDTECLDNAIAAFQAVDELTEAAMAQEGGDGSD